MDITQILKKYITDEELLNSIVSDGELLEFASQNSKLKRDFSIDSALIKSNALSIKAARALLNDKDIVLDDEGNLTGIDEAINKLKEENAFLFTQEEKYQPTQGVSFPDLSKLSDEEYYKLTSK